MSNIGDVNHIVFGSIVTFVKRDWWPCVLCGPWAESLSVCGLEGGMKAVIWTDAVQTCFMFVGIVAVVVKGSVDHGGFSSIWSVMYDDDRIQFWEYVDVLLYLSSSSSSSSSSPSSSMIHRHEYQLIQMKNSVFWVIVRYGFFTNNYSVRLWLLGLAYPRRLGRVSKMQYAKMRKQHALQQPSR